MNYRQALPDRILLQVEKPARYTGGEINSMVKNKDSIGIRFAMCFPDVYEIGMSHTGMQIIYSMLNLRDDIWCERVYSVWPDLHRIMKSEGIPLFALESQDPIKDFDFLGITLQYEMAYTNVLQIFDLAQIPFHSKDRGEDMPIVIGGGPCAFNPEPLASFFDLFYIGEGETVLFALMDAYKKNRAAEGSRLDFLKAAAMIEGIYVPQLYEAEYNPDGTIATFGPKAEYRCVVPERVRKQTVSDMDSVFYPDRPVIPYVQVTQDRAVLEIQRGCIRGCRFCQAGMIYRPFRIKSLENLKKYAKCLIDNTGYDEISLSSLSSSDYPYLGEFLEFLIEEMGERKVNISLPSLRIDEFSLDIMNKVQDVKKSSLTFAPEAGTQRMRNVINKGLTEEDILGGAGLAFKGGWNKVKLYFMLGLPTEGNEDIAGISELAEKIAMTYYDTVPKDKRRGKVQITVSTSFFIPKPFTPFQWEPMLSPEEYLNRAHMLNDLIKKQLNKKSIRYNWHNAEASVIEGLLARGDRRVGSVIEKVYENGGLFDAWTEHFDYDKWIRALDEAGLGLDFYVYRRRKKDEVLPWDFIDAGVSKAFMLREHENAVAERVTPGCKEQCSGCGADTFKGGICLENKN
ncbi:MAG: TIGR03960 family B12-binding radical SAM protein [Lachnospiraceae bacterium]|jgi:radical SAM family uncharacterized protein